MAWVLFVPLVIVSTGCLCLAGECLVTVLKAQGVSHYDEIHTGFLEQFTETGCRLYVQSPNPDYMSFRNGTRKAVAIGSSLIVAYGTVEALATQAETDKIPILFADVYNPVSLEICDASGQPIRRMTGVRGDAPTQTLLKAYVETTGGMPLSVLYDPNDPASVLQYDAIKAMARRGHIDLQPIEVGGQIDPQEILSRLPQGGRGLFITESPRLLPYWPDIFSHAQRSKTAVISQAHGAADAGALMALETDPQEQGRLLGGIARQVVSGTDPMEIPLALPKEVHLTINLQVAKNLGLKVPFDVLSMTTRVIR